MLQLTRRSARHTFVSLVRARTYAACVSSPRPLGSITRGTTNPNRLRRCDRWLLATHRDRLTKGDPPHLVDLGHGSSGVTTVEWADRVQAVRPGATVTGLEIDPERVALTGDSAGGNLAAAVAQQAAVLLACGIDPAGHIFFNQSVAGLTVGSGVTFSGVPVGQVRAIALMPETPQFIRVRIELQPDTPVLEGTWRRDGQALRLIGIEPRTGADGIARCALILDPALVRVAAVPRRAFQGWRYLTPPDAPPDLPAGRAAESPLPPKLARELAEMGLL